MNISLDWDNTFTADTKRWQKFIDLFSVDHEIYIVTSRSPDVPIEFIPDGLAGIIYCSYRAKRKVTEEQGIKIDVWIDDAPFYIENGFVIEYDSVHDREW